MNAIKVFMLGIKALLMVLAGYSVCSADISGIVTDTGGAIPLSQAAVKLEKSGQTATTATDGRFTLVTGSSILSRQDNEVGKFKPAATIRNGLLYLNVIKKSAVTITVFNLNGKALSTVRKTVDAELHSIPLPQSGAGVFVYKVQTGGNELLLKGNSIAGASQAAAVSVQNFFSYSASSKQTKTAATIDDVIRVTKSGYLNYRVIVRNPDTAALAIKMIPSAGTMTDADGNVYQTVKIGNQEWMAENLRTTKYRDNTPIPFDTSTVSWASGATPKFCYYGNTADADSIRKFGALYNWNAVDTANPKKIAPSGWHVPTDAQWDSLQNYLMANGYNWNTTTTENAMAKSLASKADWDTSSIEGAIGTDLTKNNTSGFSALPGGERNYNGVFCNIGGFGYWLSATKIDELSSYSRDLCSDWGHMYKDYGNQSCGFSIRLLRDN